MNTYNMVHIDKKWFNLSNYTQSYYILVNEKKNLIVLVKVNILLSKLYFWWLQLVHDLMLITMSYSSERLEFF